MALRCAAMNAGAHGVAIIFHHKDHGQVHQARQIQSLMESALIQRAVAQKAQRDAR